MATKSKRKAQPGDVASNRQASFRYEFLETIEAGMVLTGTEVKALRTVGAQLKDGFAAIRDGELWLHNVHIPVYAPASRENHDPDRTRKLLAHGKEIDRLQGRAKERGLTLVPTRMYFNNNRAKVEIALARGKDQYDKRQALKEKDQKREVQRALRDVGR
jgi:SsrA-binding protein